jgi:RHS repeat-associated protein
MAPGIVAETDLSGVIQAEYVFFNGKRVARIDGPTGAGGVFYYFSDHLKTASVITDATGTIKSESDYYPWGGELALIANDSNHYKFTGKERDTETGLDYFGARYYSNGLGRFISADWSATPIPVPYADLGDPQSLDLNTYVRNLPTTRTDPDGHQTVAEQNIDRDIRDLAAGRITKAEFDTRMRARALGAAIGAGIVATVALGPAGGTLARNVLGVAMAAASTPAGQQVLNGATEAIANPLPTVGFNPMSTLGIGKVTGMIEDFSVGRLANGAEIAARVETIGANTTVGILGAYNEGGAQFAGTLNSLEKGAVAVAQKAGSATVTIQAIATNAKLTKFLLKHGFSKTTVKVGKETVQAVQKTIKVAKDAN